MKRYLMVVAIALLASGCGLKIPSLLADSPAQHLLALEVEYNGVYALMRQYEDLPRCAVTESKVCSEQAAVNKMRAVNTAFDETSESAWRIVSAGS